jgi:hypothetical protein
LQAVSPCLGILEADLGSCWRRIFNLQSGSVTLADLYRVRRAPWRMLGKDVQRVASMTSPSEFWIKGFGTNWDQIAVLMDCKLLKTWWPGTELVHLRPFIPRKLLFLRRTSSARTPISANQWHKTGTLFHQSGTPRCQNSGGQPKAVGPGRNPTILDQSVKDSLYSLQ